MSNDPIREWILSEGRATQITRISPIGGGCINLASRYDTDAGSFFVKTNRYKTCWPPPLSFKHWWSLAFKYHLLYAAYFLSHSSIKIFIWLEHCVRSIGPSMFEGEALGLGAMYEAKTIRVPQPFKVWNVSQALWCQHKSNCWRELKFSFYVLKVGSLPTGGSFIVMEFIEFGASRGNQVSCLEIISY